MTDVFLIILGLLLYAKVRQVDKALLNITLGGRVGLGSKAHQSFREEISLQRLESGDDYINAHVVLVTAK